jgi:hypothetical protein
MRLNQFLQVTCVCIQIYICSKKYKFTRKTNSELEKQRKEMEEKYNINLDVLHRLKR